MPSDETEDVLSGGERRLAAIMFTDMIGYTSLGQRNESLSLALVEEQRKLIRSIFPRHHGREVKTIGDAFLIELPSALDAIRCALDVQRATREFNVTLHEDKRIHIRIGLHLGDVVESEGDIAGDAVNVASRIESLAEDAGVCLTRQIYDQVNGKFELPLLSLGSMQLKNLNAPIEVFKIKMPWDSGTNGVTSYDRKRIAILPLANISADANDEYFADGLTEELIDALSQIKGLEVIARTSVMSYKNKEKRISEIGKDLSVGSIVEGSVRKAGNKIRVSVDLIDANSDIRLWSSRYDKDLDDIFAIQSDIASRVGGSVLATLQVASPNLVKKDTEDMVAYTSFLKGRELLQMTNESALREALSHFENAIDRDPSFTRAYVGIAEAYHNLSHHGYIPFRTAVDNARAFLAKALEKDNDSAEAHSTLSYTEIMEDNLGKAKSEALLAMRINPNLADAYANLAGIEITL
ncbi:MAG TPA: adenylate/guanylate cyclase domain-containing protein, partial [Nitrososphaerales archaeon]|nr:adenylate/guanylate cyclase domain-containing protein [Nitrososphaerales archaeon]